MHADTIGVRQGEELNAAALAAWLDGKIAGAGSGVQVEQFPNGHSNLVYLVTAGGREYVLRRPPLGPVAPKAHDMAREYKVLHAVHPHFPEAPEVFLLCEDPAVLGGAFFLMERRRGIVIRDSVPPQLAAIPDYRRLVSEAFIDCLVRLHAVDVSEAGLNALGKPEGFVERQVRGWADRWNRAKTEELRRRIVSFGGGTNASRLCPPHRPQRKLPHLMFGQSGMSNRIDTAARLVNNIMLLLHP